MSWIKIEPGCQMPEIDQFCLWRTEEGNYFVKEIDKDDYAWWNGEGPPFENLPKCTHWKKITFPDEELNQEELWQDVRDEINGELKHETFPVGMLTFLKSKYTLIRK